MNSIVPQFDRGNALIIGANQGIGLGFVEQLLSNYNFNRVYATYRTLNPESKLFNLSQENPDKLTCLKMDITDEKSIQESIDRIKKEIKNLHLVIYCVGVLHNENLQPEKSLKQIVPENLIYYFQVNSIGAVLLAKHLMPLFRHREGSIFASISAKVGSIGDNGLGGWYGYRASKAALNMFLKTTSIEYSRRCPKTVVVALHPGTTDTNLSKPFQNNVPPEKLFSVKRTVTQLLKVIHGLNLSNTGEFFSWDGTPLPW